MKRLLIAALVATTALSATAASAQAYGQYDHRDSRGNYEHRHEDRRHGHWDDRRWDRPDYRDDRYRRYSRGQRFEYYRNDRYVIEDYRRYRLAPPPRGYRYYRTDRGDIVMVAIASGLIGAIIGSQLGN